MRTTCFIFLISTWFGCGLADRMDQELAQRNAWVEATLASMSLDQKAGEMTQLTLGALMVGEDPFELDEPQTFDQDKLFAAIVKHHIGSVLNCGNHAHSLEEWRSLVTRLQEMANQRVPASPILYGVDAVHGANYTTGAVLGPQQIGQAATWNPEMVHQLAAGTAKELHAAGTPWNFAPILDVGRDPRWPRFWETFGEDPLLVSTMGVAAIKGMQSTGLPIAATTKHFLGYSMPLSGKDRTPAWIPERQLREIFLPPFKAAIDAGVKTVMVNSGEINGIPVHSSRWILHDLLRVELGFEGVVVTDWEDIKYLVTRHKVALDYKEAIAMALDAGIDMSMVPLELEFPVLLVELVNEGRISEARIDESVRRILSLKWDLGLVENPGPPLTHDVSETWRNSQRAVAQRAAEQSMTLLKNESSVLPLSNDSKLWVSGPTSASIAALNGGWTGTWQGTDPNYFTPGALTAVEALDAHWSAPVGHFPLVMDFTELDIQKALMSLKNSGASAAILFLGEMPYTEIVGNDEDVLLAGNQSALVQAISATGIPTIGVYLGGRPRRMEQAITSLDAFLMAYLPGNEGGAAIARVLDGSVNPSGHLPFTWPRKSGSHLTYDRKHTEEIHTDFELTAFRPQFAFGSGLNYSPIELVNMELNDSIFNRNDTLHVTVTLKNTGNLDGEDVIHLYSQDHVASITPSVDRLRAWSRVKVEAGTIQTLNLQVPVQDLGFIGRDNQYVLEPGSFGIRIDSFVQTIQVNP